MMTAERDKLTVLGAAEGLAGTRQWRAETAVL